LTSTCLTFFVVPIMYTLLIKDTPDNDADIEAELADEPPVAVAPSLALATAHAGGEAGVTVHHNREARM
jgi:hypothetical protein